MEPLAEPGGEILAGIETAGHRDISYGQTGVMAQQMDGMIQPATVYEFHRAGIYKLTAVF